MAVSEDRKFTSKFVDELLKSKKGKTLGEVDFSNQFSRTISKPKITGIAGDVIEQSVFRYKRDNKQECDIEIDGKLVELKTTGVRIPKTDLKKVEGKTGDAYNAYLKAKEPISITAVTFSPSIQTDFNTSHFWAKSENILFVFYEYKPYKKVPAAEYANFPIVSYCYNSFSETEKEQLRNDWEIVRDYLQTIYTKYSDTQDRNKHLIGFTHTLRPQLMLIELVPGFKKLKGEQSYQHPRYRFKKTFADYIVQGHFRKTRKNTEISLNEPFNSFADFDKRCHTLTLKYKGYTLQQLKELFNIDMQLSAKSFTAKCILKMFNANCKKLNQISDFSKVGIIAKTITISPTGKNTEDMKLAHIDFEEWANQECKFEESDVYLYFCEHSFLCPVFCEHDSSNHSKTTFEGFKRFSFDETFINEEVKRTWNDTRKLINEDKLVWIYSYDKFNNKIKNKSGSYKGAPNFPKRSKYSVFIRGGSTDSSDKYKTECINGIHMIPQFFWIKGPIIAEKLKSINYL